MEDIASFMTTQTMAPDLAELPPSRGLFISKKQLSRSNIVRGDEIGKVNRQMFHAWVEDSDGNVVFDPEFPRYKMIKMIHGCDPNEPMCRHRYQQQSECVEILMKDAIQKLIKLSNVGIKPSYNFQQCSHNCYYFMKKNKGKNYNVVVGAAGWKKKNGDIWFEWG